MSFGKRKVQQHGWLEEEELDQVIAEQGLPTTVKSGISPLELAAGAAFVVAAFAGTFYFMGGAGG